MSLDSAQAYEEFFVPALFGPWAERTAGAVDLSDAGAVLDVACGTGVVARALAPAAGRVVGLDADEAMLAVARAKAPEIEWVHGDAHDLPFDDDTFDAVVCQFGLMLFDDPHRAVSEMLRVVRRDGRVVVAVWDSIERCGGYARLTGILDRLYGTEVGDALRAPFRMGNRQRTAGLFTSADVLVGTQQVPARFPSLEDWMSADIWGWLAHNHDLTQEDFDRLMVEAETELGEYVAGDGSVEVPMSAHLFTATKR